jgi:hypothetical protein
MSENNRLSGIKELIKEFINKEMEIIPLIDSVPKLVAYIITKISFTITLWRFLDYLTSLGLTLPGV